MSDKPPPLMAVEDALAHILDALHQTESEIISINDAAGRVLAEDIVARYSHPRHAISAMDGYAVAVSDAPIDISTPLEVIGEAAAGHIFSGTVLAGQAVRIFTGAYMPQGSNAVLIQEDADLKDGFVLPTEAIKAGQFVRPAGLDFEQGDVIAKAGDVLNARRWALVGLSGNTEIAVRKRPLVALLSSGDELVSAGSQPEAGQLINSNSLYLRQLIDASGGTAIDLGIIADKAGALTQTLDRARKAGHSFDLIISTGGASVGNHDHIHGDLQDASDTALTFWKIAMRPGKPVLFANWQGTAFIGLPGNPVSAGVCGLVFIMPALRKLLGQPAIQETHTAYLSNALPENDKRQDYLRARIEEDNTGKRFVETLNRQDSSMLNMFTQADVLIIRPPFAPPAGSGEQVQILTIPDQI